MAIILLRNDGQTGAWKEAFRKADPGLRVLEAGEDTDSGEILMAAVWKHPRGSLRQYPNLKGVHGLGAGVDFILEDPDLPTDIPVMRVVDPYLAADMAEFVLAQVMAHLKNLMAYKTQQAAVQWQPKPYRRIPEVTVGIMGLGKLGLAVSKLLLAAGFSVVGWTRESRPETRFPVFAGEGERGAFLKQAQVLVCLLPLTPETRGILNQGLLRELPAGAYLINVARGPLLVEPDLLRVLDEGILSGACLDVFEVEPLPESHPFWGHPLVHMTPHVASVSNPDSVVFQIVENYYRLLQGQPLKNRVSRHRGY
ncbi:2-hydroxyacid dehydrogenase [Robiginitalea marina]|uniref:Glyoxylate/hydroxypyruvate reductase A n=1 Tax=Robiginitalea marina TaxID=2954105 RepID=A0ABT1AU52_9FLAO|nr:glyoxylate/hydroxypyruvate reductase A [Robiginitalea marina]MCO5723541.1 glyoxylate/hydroxypyruvate reductase A [Robiginitalea marina]